MDVLTDVWCSTCGETIHHIEVDNIDKAKSDGIYCDRCVEWWKENELKSEDHVDDY